MPLEGTAKTVMSKFIKRYGKKKGKNVFYAHANSSKKFASAMGEQSVYERGHPK